MAPVEPLDVEIGESEVLLPAGTISSMLEGTIVVQVIFCIPSLFPHNSLSLAMSHCCALGTCYHKAGTGIDACLFPVCT